MKILKTLSQWREVRGRIVDSIGFVPTMGGLHAGHASLIQRCVADNTVSVLSIYVNPTQFNNATDLESYPDTLEADLALAQELGVDFVLLPSYEELYPDDFRFKISESELSNELCGEHRPGHFDGVMTVVMKLLNVIAPRRAYFGEKDYQQFELIRDMCAAFYVPVKIVPCPTVRETDGLAMSTRNLRLTPADRRLAPEFARQLRRKAGDTEVNQTLTDLGFAVDYVISRGGRRFGAAALGSGDHAVRLIDNVALLDQGIVPIAAGEKNTAPELAEAV